jgi:hypothetical protein
VKENSAGATEEARDKKGEGVVDWGCTDDTRDQPNNDVRMALEDGPGGGASFCIDDSSSGGFSSPVFSSAGNSAPTDAITDRRALTWVEDKGCLISMPSRTDSKERALVLISFAMTAGDDRCMR